jgi:spore coat protein U-like protein
MRKYFLPVTVAAVLFGASNANAVTTATGNFTAHVKLNATCTVSATILEFGALGLITGAETATSTVSVKCTKGSAYTLALDTGTTMVGVTTPADTVAYTASFAAATAGTGNGNVQTFTINGALPVQATPSAQDYNATKTVTVSY